MANNFIIEQLKGKFKDRESFTREELFDFFLQFEPDLKKSTFRWRIFNLKAKNIILPVARGHFTVGYKPKFKATVGTKESKIFTKIEKQFPGIKQCIWSTQILNEFMLHVPGRFLTILEVEKDALEPVYAFIKEQKYPNVFIKPVEKEIERYIFETESAIILQSLVSKAPIQKTEKVNTQTIEKLIIDLYCKKALFSAYQGSELIHIINNAYNRYSIDFTKLLGYAKRRRKDIEIMEFLSNKTDIPKSILND